MEASYGSLFLENISSISIDSRAKLKLYANIKKKFEYEKYLDLRNSVALTRIRLSSHWFPIERGRPFIERENRLCSLCHTGVGDETHCMISCPSPEIQTLKKKLLENLFTISPQLNMLTTLHDSLLFYLLKAHESLFLPYIIKWCKDCNEIFKIAQS